MGSSIGSVVGGIGGSFFGMPQVGAALGGAVGGMLDSSGQRSSSDALAASQADAAREAAAAGRFRPVGITTGFGTSNFKTDAQGNVTSAGYDLTPEMLAQRQALMGMSEQGLGQYQQAFGQSQQLGQAGQGLMGLGQGYLATTPQEQAAKYMADQQALLAPSRAVGLSTLQNKMFQQGRGGLAVGGEAGMMATNPEMAAYYNSIAQQDANLAAQATQGGQQYAQFGAGLLGTGGDLMQQQYATQNAAFSPYQTALGGAQTVEGLGQQAMDLGVNIGAQGKGGINQGLLQQGLMQSGQTRADAGNQWSNVLAGANRQVSPYIPEIQQKVGGWFGVNDPYAPLSSSVTSNPNFEWGV